MCYSPIAIKNKDGNGALSHYSVPCGACVECRKRRSASWVFRLQQEQKVHRTSLFTTLTYSDDQLRRDECGYPTLVKSDLQRFFKRLRKRCRIKYYACGEYGSNTQRPHYHAIIFGAESERVQSAWTDGQVHFGQVTPASITYVTKYMCKPRMLDIGDRQPEFSLMSQGLGKNYLTPEIIAYHEANMADYVTNPGGVKQSIPRYYKDRIFTESDRIAMAAKHATRHALTEDEAIKMNKDWRAYEVAQWEQLKAIVRADNFKSKQRSKL